MTTKLNWKTLSLFAAMIVLAAVLWACGSAAQQANAPAAQPTDLPAATVVTPATATASTNPTTTAPSADNTAKVRVFTIDQSKSEARFTLHEVLMGSPKTVVGVTPSISGTITIDLADPTKTTISSLQIDARDFRTDSDMRNGAIRRFVLQSSKDEYRYIVFTPKTIEGLSKTAKAGDTFELKINGDLTVSGVTKPVTFVTTVKVASDNELSGLAKTQVLRSDFGLKIPSVPTVANVTDEVQLELQFSAKAE
jgi:polyisoprenoid-binding protein YceI